MKAELDWRAAVRNVNWLTDHPEQQPDEVLPDGQLVFHFRKQDESAAVKAAPVPELKEISAVQFEKMARTGAERIRQKTNDSYKKCLFWAHAEILKRYRVKEAA